MGDRVILRPDCGAAFTAKTARRRSGIIFFIASLCEVTKPHLFCHSTVTSYPLEGLNVERVQLAQIDDREKRSATTCGLLLGFYTDFLQDRIVRIQAHGRRPVVEGQLKSGELA